MPPQLALIICTVFVIFLLWLDQKQTSKISVALWIPTIWILHTASKPLAVWFELSEGDPESGSPVDRVFLSGVLCLGMLILTRRKFNWSHAIKEHKWLMLMIGYMLISISWSDIPFISFKRWIREFTALVMALLVATERDPRKALESLFRRSVYILIPFSLLLIKYFQDYGVQYGHWSGERMWIGVTLQKNGLGRLCAISAIFIVWTFIKRWQVRERAIGMFQNLVDLFILILTFMLLKGPPGSYPATGVIALGAGLCTFISFLWMKKQQVYLFNNIFIIIIALFIAIGIATPFAGGALLGKISPLLGRDETLTGRTEIWKGLIKIIEQEPILGAGFGGFWTNERMEIHNIDEAHNGYLDVLLELGCPGILLLSMFLLHCCKRAQREMIHNFNWGLLWICYLVMSVIHNITESSINNLTNHLTAILLFMAVSIPNNRDQKDR